MSTQLEQVADGVHRYADGLVNWYLLEDGGELTVVDTGWPRSWPRIEQAVTGLGRSLDDVRAVLLTHGHADHLGAADKARQAANAPVRVHRKEVARVRGQAHGGSPFSLVPGLLPHLWRPTAFGFVLHATAHGFLTPRWVGEVSAFEGGSPLDVPGRPQPVLAPGHTEGHTAYHLPEQGVLFSGDALATLDVLTREQGPRLMPDALNSDPTQARESLDSLKPLEANTLLPGHGDPWAGTPAEAVARAQDTVQAA